MSDLTLTLLRLGLLALLWIFVFSVVGVLRTDIYGTSVSRRSQRKALREQERQQRRAAKEARRAPAPAAAVPAAPAPAPARGRFGRGRSKGVPTRLVVTEGPLAGTSLPLRGQAILIGRNPECALVLDDDYASGRHCRIEQDPSGAGGWVVEDLGSTNGTFIGRDKLTTPQPVEVGTTLRIGKTLLEFRD
ncbi:FHA domain-containing protein [Intrasporangium sp. DVR]|uniref:FHA domain-containing protein FhaB/FipA n=1 Tax=Intrasporangium sp. DVR TaxID=3127867 RepID=UPI00313A6786